MIELNSQKLLKIGKSDITGRTYPLDEVQLAISRVNQPILCEPTTNIRKSAEKIGTVDASQVSHSVSNLRIEDDFLVGDVKILDTPAGITLQDRINGGIDTEFRLQCVAELNQECVVSEIRSMGFFVLSDEMKKLEKTVYKDDLS